MHTHSKIYKMISAFEIYKVINLIFLNYVVLYKIIMIYYTPSATINFYNQI